MIFTKDNIGTFLEVKDNNANEYGFQVINLAIRQGFTQYDLFSYEQVMEEYNSNADNLLTDDNANWLEAVYLQAIHYLNENCTDGVTFIHTPNGLVLTHSDSAEAIEWISYSNSYLDELGV